MRGAFHSKPSWRRTLPFRKTVFRENFGKFSIRSYRYVASDKASMSTASTFFFLFSFIARLRRRTVSERARDGSVKVVGEIWSNAICGARLVQSVTGIDRWRAAPCQDPDISRNSPPLTAHAISRACYCSSANVSRLFLRSLTLSVSSIPNRGRSYSFVVHKWVAWKSSGNYCSSLFQHIPNVNSVIYHRTYSPKYWFLENIYIYVCIISINFLT